MYEVKSKRVVVTAKGVEKEVTEIFVVENGERCADAEYSVDDYFNGDCEVIGVNLSKIREIVNYPTQEEKENLHVFKAIVVDTFVTEEGEEKETCYPLLVWAESVEDAMTKVKAHLAQGYSEMSISSITKTKIMEVI